MTRLVEFPLESGGVAVVQVADGMDGMAGIDDPAVRRDRPVTRGMRDGAVAERAQQTFEQAVDRVQPATEALIARFRSMSRPPDEVSVGAGDEVCPGVAVGVGAGVSAPGKFSDSTDWSREIGERMPSDPAWRRPVTSASA